VKKGNAQAMNLLRVIMMIVQYLDSGLIWAVVFVELEIQREHKEF